MIVVNTMKLKMESLFYKRLEGTTKIPEREERAKLMEQNSILENKISNLNKQMETLNLEKENKKKKWNKAKKELKKHLAKKKHK